MRSIRRKPIILWLLASLFMSQLGCAHAPPRPPSHTALRLPYEEERAQFGTIGIVSARFIPESTFNIFAKRGFAAVKGVALGALAGGCAGLEAFHYSGLEAFPYFFAPGLTPLEPVFLVGGMTIGALAGGISGAAPEDRAVRVVLEERAKKTEGAIIDFLAELSIQETMAEHVFKTGMELTDYRFELLEGQGPASPDEKPNYGYLKEKGIDTVLEVSVSNVGFEGERGKNPIPLFMSLQTRLIQLTDELEIYSQEFGYKSRTRNFFGWDDFAWAVSNNQRLLREEFDPCYKNLAGRIVEELFLLYDFPLDSHTVCGLHPKHPECRYSSWRKRPRYVEVDSFQPTLQWESFPRPEGLPADEIGLLSRISDVGYDLKIWRVKNDFPVELVYTRQRLLDSSHKIEHPLEPSTRYFWTVRARFKLDGQSRVTKWSYSRMPWLPQGLDPCTLDHIPVLNHLRFITPSPSSG